MKRDPRLHGLSSEHHQALVLARQLSSVVEWTQEDGDALRARFERELEPHFAIEEELLLPALRRAGREALCEQVEREHAAIRSGVASARGGDVAAAHALGAALTSHVRFEERELFPACEVELGDALLDEVARRAPKSG
ncbi:MAG: hemerythrin domain-containing protein [Polyangiaceae bacterium]|jgi:hemerythrin-like domain-containing protein|nr:hemerythrin domain-containing protein [Polyangiaceae bacterium]